MGRFEGIVEGVLLASAARTATVSSADQSNYGCRGVIVTVDATASADSPSVVMTITYKDPASGAYETLLTSAAITGTARNSYLIYPAAGAAASDVTQVVEYPLPKTWRVTMTHDDADSITYSVGYSLLR